VPRLAAFVVFILLAGCGKVAAPQPPFIRVPEAIRDLAVIQNGYDVVLSWTNPSRNIDGSAATDLARVHISNDGVDIAAMPATGSGKPQSHAIDAHDWVGVERLFGVRVETVRGKTSELSTAKITPIDVPGSVVSLDAVVDQYSITLSWSAPGENTRFANDYIVMRSDREAPVVTTETQFNDSMYDRGKQYTYEVVAARRVDNALIRGVDPQRKTISAVDTTAPKAPTDLELVVTDSGAILTWKASEELDLAGYRVFRDKRPLTSGVRAANSFSDPDYKPGFVYSVSAVDEFGNESPVSAPISK
jgi:hypothetical protein